MKTLDAIEMFIMFYRTFCFRCNLMVSIHAGNLRIAYIIINILFLNIYRPRTKLTFITKNIQAFGFIQIIQMKWCLVFYEDARNVLSESTLFA